MSDQDVFELLKVSTQAAMDRGLNLDRRTYGLEEHGPVYAPRPEGSVCLIGGFMIGRRRRSSSVLRDFANAIGREIDWAYGFQAGSQGLDLLFPGDLAGHMVAQRLVRWLELENAI